MRWLVVLFGAYEGAGVIKSTITGNIYFWVRRCSKTGKNNIVY